jgi:cytochrome P450
MATALTTPSMTSTTAPVVRGSFLLGSALDLRRDLLGACERAFHEYGDVVVFRVGPPGLRREICLVFHPDAAHRVLAGNWMNYRKDNIFYNEIRRAFGDGLLTSQDDDWQRQKRFLQPLFTARRVAGYAAAMSEQVDQLITRWRSQQAGTVDLKDEMTALSLRVVCRILFGDDVDQALPVVQHAFGPLGEEVRRRGLAPFRPPMSWPTSGNRRLLRALVGLLLSARDEGGTLTAVEVRDQVLIFLLAGHETTSTALTYTLHLLGRHPEVQDRVREEAEAAGIDTKLPYTEMVLKEAMRLYPSAPLIGRLSVAEDEICGYHIPAGTDIIAAPWVTHRHPQFWDQPERFDPERFTPEREKARHRYAWFPFGGGPRSCIGQHFSMLESTVALARLIRAFTFTTPPGEPSYTNHITLRPTSPVPSVVTARIG